MVRAGRPSQEALVGPGSRPGFGVHPLGAVTGEQRAAVYYIASHGAVGMRALRHRLREYLARVEAGEEFEVTLFGRTVAQLQPPSGRPGGLAQLIAEGRVTPALEPDTRLCRRPSHQRRIGATATLWPSETPTDGDCVVPGRFGDHETHHRRGRVVSLLSFIGGRALMSSRVAVVEVSKAVARANSTADPQSSLPTSRSSSRSDLARIASATGGPALRALDAIHVASALRLGGDIEAFLTYDDRQAEAARAAGLTVASPR